MDTLPLELVDLIINLGAATSPAECEMIRNPRARSPRRTRLEAPPAATDDRNRRFSLPGSRLTPSPVCRRMKITAVGPGPSDKGVDDEEPVHIVAPSARSFLLVCSLVSKQWSVFAQHALVRDMQVTGGGRMRKAAAMLDAKGWAGRVETLWASSTSLADGQVGRLLAMCPEVTRLCCSSLNSIDAGAARAPMLFLSQAGHLTSLTLDRFVIGTYSLVVSLPALTDLRLTRCRMVGLPGHRGEILPSSPINSLTIIDDTLPCGAHDADPVPDLIFSKRLTLKALVIDYDPEWQDPLRHPLRLCTLPILESLSAPFTYLARCPADYLRRPSDPILLAPSDVLSPLPLTLCHLGITGHALKWFSEATLKPNGLERVNDLPSSWNRQLCDRITTWSTMPHLKHLSFPVGALGKNMAEEQGTMLRGVDLTRGGEIDVTLRKSFFVDRFACPRA